MFCPRRSLRICSPIVIVYTSNLNIRKNYDTHILAGFFKICNRNRKNNLLSNDFLKNGVDTSVTILYNEIRTKYIQPRNNQYQRRTEGMVIEMTANAQKVTLIMARRCMNLQDLAKAAGLPPQTVNATIRGRGVRPATLGKVARALGCDPSDLMDMDMGVNSQPQASTPGRQGKGREANLTIVNHGKTFPVTLKIARYGNGNLAIVLMRQELEGFWDV